VSRTGFQVSARYDSNSERNTCAETKIGKASRQTRRSSSICGERRMESGELNVGMAGREG
jgi:hypothetical protein